MFNFCSTTCIDGIVLSTTRHQIEIAGTKIWEILSNHLTSCLMQMLNPTWPRGKPLRLQKFAITLLNEHLQVRPQENLCSKSHCNQNLRTDSTPVLILQTADIQDPSEIVIIAKLMFRPQVFLNLSQLFRKFFVKHLSTD